MYIHSIYIILHFYYYTVDEPIVLKRVRQGSLRHVTIATKDFLFFRRVPFSTAAHLYVYYRMQKGRRRRGQNTEIVFILPVGECAAQLKRGHTMCVVVAVVVGVVPALMPIKTLLDKGHERHHFARSSPLPL